VGWYYQPLPLAQGAAANEGVLDSSGLGNLSGIGASEVNSVLSVTGLGTLSFVGASEVNSVLSGDDLGILTGIGGADFSAVLDSFGLGNFNAEGAFEINNVLSSSGLTVVEWHGAFDYEGEAMAIRVVVPISDASRGFAVAAWSGLLNLDTGEAFDSAGWTLMSVQWQGTPGVGFDGDMQGTNEPVATNWSDIVAFSNATGNGLIIPIAGGVAYPISTRWMRPNVKAGDGTTNMTCYALFRRGT